MSLRQFTSLALAAALLAGCSTLTRDFGSARPEGGTTLAVESMIPPEGQAPVDQSALTPSRPATKNNVVVAQYATSFNYGEMANRIDRTFRSCWLGKKPEFAGYTYGGLKQDQVKYIITLNEQVNGQSLDLVKVTVVPASGQNGFAVSLESRAEGSPGEKTIQDGIRHLASGQRVC